MKIIFWLWLALSAAWGREPIQATKGFVEIRPNHKLYVEVRPPQNGATTLYLANGLTYTTEQWDLLVQALDQIDPDLGIVRWDMMGQGQTARAHIGEVYDIPFAQQVEDLRDLKSQLKISGPSALIGLSYGGAIALSYAAQYAGDFDHFVAIAPFLERLPEQDVEIRAYVRLSRALGDPRDPEDIYDFFLRRIVYTRYPLAEPILYQDYPFRLEPTYRMVKGAKKWNAVAALPKLPRGKVHVLGGIDDPYVTLDRLEWFLHAAPPDLFASVGFMKYSHHKLVEERPEISAAWLYQILQGNPNLFKNLTFTIDPHARQAQSGSVVVPLDFKSIKKGSCADLL